VPEPLAKVVDYANHAQWHATDPKARKDMEDMLAGRWAKGRIDRRGNLVRGHSIQPQIGLKKGDEAIPVAKIFNSYR
jgi:hypothetical protein